MGHTNSKSNGQGPVPEYRPDFEVVRVIDDPNYGRVKLVREEKTHQQMILKEFIFDTKQAYEEELKFFRERASFDHPNMVQVIGYNATHNQNLCSTLFKVAVFIEVLPNELWTTLKGRKKNAIQYPEHDVLLIAENVISALHHLQTKNTSHGDIRPVNLFLYGQTYKVTDPRLEIDRNANALTKAIIDKSQTLLAPELLVKVPTGKFESHEDKHKADVFSLGMTLLNVATLKNSEEIYDYKNGKLDERLLNERLHEVHDNYSQFTFELIAHMLTMHAEERPSFIELKDILRPYEEAIRSKGNLPFLHGHGDHHAPAPIQQRQGERAKKAAVQIDDDLMHHDDHHHVEPQRQEFHHHEPVVVRNAPPQFQDNFDIDDLEKKIRAAMARTQETYKQVQIVDAHVVGSDGHHNTHVSSHTIESRPGTGIENGQQSGFVSRTVERPPLGFESGQQRTRQEEKAHSKAPMPLLFEEDDHSHSFQGGKPVERNQQSNFQIQNQGFGAPVFNPPEPQLQNTYSFADHRTTPVVPQIQNFPQTFAPPPVQQVQQQSFVPPPVFQPDFQRQSQGFGSGFGGASTSGYQNEAINRPAVYENRTFENIHIQPPTTSFSTTTNYNFGGPSFGHDNMIRSGTGEHAVRSTPTGHLGLGEDLKRSVDIRKSQDIGGHNAAFNTYTTTTTTGFGGDHHHLPPQPTPIHDVMTFSQQNVDHSAPRTSYHDIYSQPTPVSRNVTTNITTFQTKVDHSAPQAGFHDNVASFNYALGGSPERRTRSTSPQKHEVIIGDNVRTTYGQNEHAYDFGGQQRGTNLGQDYHFATTTDHHDFDYNIRPSNVHNERVVKAYQTVDVQDTHHTHSDMDVGDVARETRGTAGRRTNADEVLRAFYSSDDAPYVHDTTSPSKEANYIAEASRRTYGTRTPYAAEDRPSGAFGEAGSAVSKYTYTAVEPLDQQPGEFQASPTRYI